MVTPAPQMLRHIHRDETAKLVAFASVMAGDHRRDLECSPHLYRAVRPYHRCRARIVINREMGRG